MAKPIPDLFVPDPVPAGDPAGICWGAGEPFGDLETPESVFVVFSGILRGPNWLAGDAEPPNGTFEVPQDPGTAEIFRLGGAFSISLSFGLVQTSLSGRINPAPDLFFEADVVDQCVIKFINEVNDVYVGGSGYVYIPKALL